MVIHINSLGEKIDLIEHPSTNRGAELAAEILDVIAANPEQHEQEDFGIRTECGTTMCIAGWATYLTGHAGYRHSVYDNRKYLAPFETYGDWIDGRMVEAGAVFGHALRIINPDYAGFDKLGADLLGLDYETADRIFLEMNNAVALELLRQVANGQTELDYDAAKAKVMA